MTKRKGMFLIFALWVLTLLTLFCMGLGFRTFIQTKKTKLLLSRQRAFNLAVSGIKIAKQVLLEDFNADKNADHLQEKWAQPIEKEVEFSSPFKKGKLSVRIEDESSRFNVNSIVKDSVEGMVEGNNEGIIDGKSFKVLLRDFFDKVEIDDADNKVDCILDYIDTNDDYESRSPDSEKEVKNEKLSVPEELLLIKSISSEDYNKIKDFITVFGSDQKLNINTIKEELLDSLFEESLDPSLAEDVKDIRIKNKYYSNGCLPDSEEDCIKLPIELPTTLFKTNSEFFRIVSEGEVGGVKKQITSVVERNENSCEILYWYEK